MSFTGDETSGPVRYPIAIADMTCGIYASMGILAALLSREKTGHGQFLDMALFDAQITWLANAGSSYLNAGVIPTRMGNAHPNIVPYGVFQGRDGLHFVVGVGTEPLWQKFARLVATESNLASDPRFRDNALRIKNRDALIPILRDAYRQKSASEWLALFANAEIPAAPINAIPEALENMQSRNRGLVVQLEHPVLGAIKNIANPIRMSDTPVSYRLAPPLLGEHTIDILKSLDYSNKDARALANNS
jgi:crotonobetainyl-CoA:carnitine CoA-transferase CaiB-like acyl-CoA transferase